MMGETRRRKKVPPRRPARDSASPAASVEPAWAGGSSFSSGGAEPALEAAVGADGIRSRYRPERAGIPC